MITDGVLCTYVVVIEAHRRQKFSWFVESCTANTFIV